jgi:hypothetical protein
VAPYRISSEGARVGSLCRGLSDNYMAMAEEQGMPQDLMCRATTVQQDDSDTEMVSVEPSNEHVLNKENIDNG